ncbi:hypothetical protein QR680_014853 [Steinernema hermaphroditum]|uniref:Uncharacterized protein n=1 Tax=Steinernema hermaphroditum TaxID=289476 RepID=A0AA39M3X7_9BILA|nr:hypothetical protein QR680_014853 [Steinernema hermaphroditum]
MGTAHKEFWIGVDELPPFHFDFSKPLSVLLGIKPEAKVTPRDAQVEYGFDEECVLSQAAVTNPEVLEDTITYEQFGSQPFVSSTPHIAKQQKRLIAHSVVESEDMSPSPSADFASNALPVRAAVKPSSKRISTATTTTPLDEMRKGQKEFWIGIDKLPPFHFDFSKPLSVLLGIQPEVKVTPRDAQAEGGLDEERVVLQAAVIEVDMLEDAVTHEPSGSQKAEMLEDALTHEPSGSQKAEMLEDAVTHEPPGSQPCVVKLEDIPPSLFADFASKPLPVRAGLKPSSNRISAVTTAAPLKAEVAPAVFGVKTAVATPVSAESSYEAMEIDQSLSVRSVCVVPQALAEKTVYMEVDEQDSIAKLEDASEKREDHAEQREDIFEKRGDIIEKLEEPVDKLEGRIEKLQEVTLIEDASEKRENVIEKLEEPVAKLEDQIEKLQEVTLLEDVTLLTDSINSSSGLQETKQNISYSAKISSHLSMELINSVASTNSEKLKRAWQERRNKQKTMKERSTIVEEPEDRAKSPELITVEVASTEVPICTAAKGRDDVLVKPGRKPDKRKSMAVVDRRKVSRNMFSVGSPFVTQSPKKKKAKLASYSSRISADIPEIRQSVAEIPPLPRRSMRLRSRSPAEEKPVESINTAKSHRSVKSTSQSPVEAAKPSPTKPASVKRYRPSVKATSQSPVEAAKPSPAKPSPVKPAKPTRSRKNRSEVLELEKPPIVRGTTPPSDSHQEGQPLRRSSRNRVPTLQHHLGQRIEYVYDSDGNPTVERVSDVNVKRKNMNQYAMHP